MNEVGAESIRPDPSFVKRLHDYNPEIGVVWNKQLQRFVIVEIKGQVRRLLFIVQNDDKTFRPLDDRIFARLWEGDPRKRSYEEIFSEIDRKNEKADESSRKKFSDEIDSKAREDWRYFCGVPMFAVNGRRKTQQWQQTSSGLVVPAGR